MSLLDGARSPETQEGRARLSVRDPLIENLLAGLGFEGETLDEMRQFCKRLCCERNRHAIEKRQRAKRDLVGLFGQGGVR